MSTTNLWITDPAKAHKLWRDGLGLGSEEHSRKYAAQSQRVYNSLFESFCAWMLGKPANLKTLTQADLTEFLERLEGRGSKPKAFVPAADRTKRTYLAEIDRVLTHIQSLDLRADNPARLLLESLRASIKLEPRSITLPKHALDTRKQYLKTLATPVAENASPEQLQNIAMNLLMLDLGLTLKELQKLKLVHTEKVPEGTIDAPGHRVLGVRTLQLTPEAQKWLLKWLHAREGLNIISQSEYKARKQAGRGLLAKSIEPTRVARSNVFVSFAGKAGAGQKQGVRGQGLAIDRIPDSTIYLSAQEVIQAGEALDDAELAKASHKGPQVLRNLCCARLVAKGIQTGEIADFLGLKSYDQVWAMARHLEQEGLYRKGEALWQE